MIVKVRHHHDYGKTRTFSGPPQEVAADLLHAHPFLRGVTTGNGAPDPRHLAAHLSAQQAYSATVSPDEGEDLVLRDLSKSDYSSAQLGDDPEYDRYRRAAAVLAGAGSHSLKRPHRHADPVDDALHSVGLDLTEENRKGVKAIADLKKSGGIAFGDAVAVSSVEPGIPGRTVIADAVKRAGEKASVWEIKLGEGRHNHGSIAASDPEDDAVYLLKPNVGGLSPAAGEHEQLADAVRREAAFAAAAHDVFMVKEVLPCDVVVVNGVEYAATPLLGASWKNCNQIAAEDPTKTRRIMAFHAGDVHRWATMDFVLGNADDNAGNVLVRGGEVRLIDHGAAFAGTDFSPRDPDTYVPYYLRVGAPADFESMSPDDKLRHLPRLHPDGVRDLAAWVSELSEERLAAAVRPFGVISEPCISRLRDLKTAVAGGVPADLAVLRCWV
jgi:hypothetical protein